MKPRVIIFSIIGGLIIGTIAIVLTTIIHPVRIPSTKLISQDVPTRGSDATYTLTEFANYQCSQCADYVHVLNELASEYDEHFTLAYHQVNLPTEYPLGTEAAYAAEAANLQGKFWEYSNALYQNQSKLGPDLYIQIAEQLQLDINAFNKDKSSEAVQQRVNASTRLIGNVDTTDLPVFFFNGKRLPHMSPQELKTTVMEYIPYSPLSTSTIQSLPSDNNTLQETPSTE